MKHHSHEAATPKDPHDNPERYPQLRKRRKIDACSTKEPSDNTAAPDNTNAQSLMLASTTGLIITADIPAGPPGPPDSRLEAKRPVGGIQIPTQSFPHISPPLSPVHSATTAPSTYLLPATPTAVAIEFAAQSMPSLSLPPTATKIQYSDIAEYHDEQRHEQYYDVTPPASTAMTTTAVATAPMTSAAMATTAVATAPMTSAAMATTAVATAPMTSAAMATTAAAAAPMTVVRETLPPTAGTTPTDKPKIITHDKEGITYLLTLFASQREAVKNLAIRRTRTEGYEADGTPIIKMK
jgi:hypothetical protein